MRIRILLSKDGQIYPFETIADSFKQLKELTVEKFKGYKIIKAEKWIGNSWKEFKNIKL